MRLVTSRAIGVANSLPGPWVDGLRFPACVGPPPDKRTRTRIPKAKKSLCVSLSDTYNGQWHITSFSFLAIVVRIRIPCAVYVVSKIARHGFPSVVVQISPPALTPEMQLRQAKYTSPLTSKSRPESHDRGRIKKRRDGLDLSLQASGSSGRAGLPAAASPATGIKGVAPSPATLSGCGEGPPCWAAFALARASGSCG